LWEETLGLYGLDERNDAGEEFLELCATNNLTIMNTWFQKKDLHLGTWMHPATKRHHMIDFVVMRTSQRSLCSDVQVMRGANCWSDHHMLRAKLTVKFPIPFTIHRFGDHQTQKLFSDSLTSTLPISPTDSSEQSLTKCMEHNQDLHPGNSQGDHWVRKEVPARLVLRECPCHHTSD
jgi:hypothetical protein